MAVVAKIAQDVQILTIRTTWVESLHQDTFFSVASIEKEIVGEKPKYTSKICTLASTFPIY